MWCQNKNCSTLSLIRQIPQLNTLLPMGKSGCELSPPARSSGPRGVKISLRQEDWLQYQLRELVNQLRMCCKVLLLLVVLLVVFCFVFIFFFLLLKAFLRTVFYETTLLLEVMITRKSLLENACWAYCFAS